MMSNMTLDWARLATEIRRERESRRMPDGSRMTQQQLADEAGVSLGTIANLEDPKYTYSRRPPSLPNVERVLWAPGSVDSVLAGGNPTPRLDERGGSAAAPVEPPSLSDAAGERLPLRVRHELKEGDIVDTEVINLSQGRMKMVVVITREPGDEASDEQLREDFREWSRVQRELRGITAEPESDDPSVT